MIEQPKLNEGERLVGLLSDKDLRPYWCILLPGDYDDSTHEAQLEWAKSIGGDLPNRIEQAMLWANHRDQFKKAWYWSNEIHHSESGWAWCQGFRHGYQDYDYRIDELRARAVRRVYVKTNVGSSDEKGGAAKCQSCLGTGKCAKAAILPEPPDVQCPTCRGTGKGGAA